MQSYLNRTHHKHHGRVSSTYAEIYLNDSYCDNRKPVNTEVEISCNEEWVSPSDLLIGIVQLTPPFTSKITRGKTHQGILAIGNEILQKEYAKFQNNLAKLLKDNDDGWAHILESEKKSVQQKVRRIYNNIFESKSNIMSHEISEFYENTLQELEGHMKSELKTVLTSARANIISDYNNEMKNKLAEGKSNLKRILDKKYTSEIGKIERYYSILLNNEKQRHEQLINQALQERNDALLAFYKNIEAENIASTMYVMCTERKKCKIKQLIVDNYQKTDISEKLQKIKVKQEVLDTYKKREHRISDINRDWEEKIKKVLLLFLKFISFCLKLLPEQTTFLLDLEKMVVLQMNEMQKHPKKFTSILKEELLQNIFKFKVTSPEPPTCKDEPFFIIGDLSEVPPPKYGSRETLPDDVELPLIRVGRQFLYGKCHKFEQIMELMEKQRCKCEDVSSSIKENIFTISPPPIQLSLSVSQTESVSLDEPLLIDDITRLHTCPARSCQNWAERNSFPYLNSYLDFTEDNFERVKTIFSKQTIKEASPDLIDPNDYVKSDLPFLTTKERYHNIETQYSSQEELYVPLTGCTCFGYKPLKSSDLQNETKESPSEDLNATLQQRRNSLKNILRKNPLLLKMFTDECYDFQL